ncbi:Uma2 family endonuclease [Streptomyces paludis]|uniref:Uma2 family endonuclease n=1 Tax=Streptomyces paludis TaxID=2282738 RepID=A0A345HSV8_9ACTN|nr:Uma2 family endonuclease [Streptomyces paludis]AXG79782.1 Uma2 family endonuclease [Streptomyces paludis]
MSAAPEHGLEPRYEWPIPPAGGWTADDLDRIPGLPPHAELIDGSLVLMSPQTRFHMRTMRLLENILLDQVPDDLDVDREMTIRIDAKNRPEPDILVFLAEGATGPRQTWHRPEDIVLAIEVVSEDSLERDRDVKPRKYAEAGVRHFWRVEEERGLPVVYSYERDPATQVYVPTGIHRERLVLKEPFPIEIDLTAVNRRRSAEG